MKKRWDFLIVSATFFIFLFGCRSIPMDTIYSQKTYKGKDFIKKELFYSSENKKGIVNIAKLSLCSSEAYDIAIFDCQSMHRVNIQAGTIKQKVNFKNGCVFRPTLYALTCDNYLIYNSGGGFSNIVVIDSTGNFLWSYNPPDTQVYKMVAGDLDRDGEVEFYAATSQGLHKISSKGEKIWGRGGMVWNVGIFSSPDNTSDYLLVRSNKSDSLEIYNYLGNFIRELNLEVRISDFKICNWPELGHFLARYQNTFYILDFNGKVVFQHKLDFGLNFHDISSINGVPVKLKNSNEIYLAIILQFRKWRNKSLICIISPKKELIYQEILPGDACLAVVPSAIYNNKEAFFVGDGLGKVYMYEMVETK